jgi:hypothetical protein
MKFSTLITTFAILLTATATAVSRRGEKHHYPIHKQPPDYDGSVCRKEGGKLQSSALEISLISDTTSPQSQNLATFTACIPTAAVDLAVTFFRVFMAVQMHRAMRFAWLTARKYHHRPRMCVRKGVYMKRFKRLVDEVRIVGEFLVSGSFGRLARWWMVEYLSSDGSW